VKPQPRFNSYGVPQNKTKKTKGDAKETVPNGNYLWINLFAASLNDTGRAALVMANSASDAGHSEKDIRIKLIKSGVISQMVTLPTNMFTSVTLPATLWFFDRAKSKKDEILFIDARNIFTQITRAHRKFSDEQIKNLAIITRLYEGKTDEFDALLDEYRAALTNAPEISDDEDTPPKAYWQNQIDWLTSRFPDGKYVDVVGLCKAAKLDGEDGVIDQDYSLNPGRYVGVVIEDDGMTEDEFKVEMLKLNSELSALNSESHTLEKTIADNLRLLLVGGE
jgi:type I restriction enzyme M protein